MTVHQLGFWGVWGLWGIMRLLALAGLIALDKLVVQRIEDARYDLHTARTEGIFYRNGGFFNTPQKIRVGASGVYLARYGVFSLSLGRLGGMIFIAFFAVFDLLMTLAIMVISLALVARLTAS